MFTVKHLNSIVSASDLAFKVEIFKGKNIQLWVANSNIYDHHKGYSAYHLSRNERNRAKRFHSRKDHDLFVIGRYLTRVILGHYTNNKPENIRLIPDTFGKPYADVNLYFNLSHSHNQVFLGVSNAQIGVDIEIINADMVFDNIIKNNFSIIECQFLRETSKGKKVDTFFELWTKKESVIKAIGKGINIPLQSFNVIHPDGKVSWNTGQISEKGDWFVHNIEIKKGFKAAVATQIHPETSCGLMINRLIK